MKRWACFACISALLLAANCTLAAQKNIFDDDWTPPKPAETAKPAETTKPRPPNPVESAKPVTPDVKTPAVVPPEKITPPVITPPAARRAIPTREQQAASRKVLKEVFADQLID